MDNEQFDNTGSDYQYAGDQYSTSEYQGANSGDAGSDKHAKVKRLLIVLGFVLIAFVVYKVASVYMHKMEEGRAITPLSTSTTNLPGLTTQSMKSSLPSGQSTGQASSASLLSDSSSKQLNQLNQMHTVVKQHLQHISDQNESLNGELSQMSLTISGVNSTLSNLTANVSTVNQNMQALNQRVAELQKLQRVQQTVLAEQEAERMQRAKVTYQIQAIVPGRAWLKGSDGSTLTVGVGDNVPNYGLIDRIDLKQGLIITNSGRILRYGIAAS